MTQRNEEWVRDNGSGRLVLTAEVIDETVRMIPEVLAGIQGKTTVGHSAAVVLPYREFVQLVYEAGFRPIDLKTREPLRDWKPRPPETKRR